MDDRGALKHRYHAISTRFEILRTPKITGRLSSSPEICYRTSHINCARRDTRTSHARCARAPRRDLWRPRGRREARAARAANIGSRRDHGQSRRTARQRSCDARQQHTVNACEQARRVRAAAAHRLPRRCPTTAGPPSEALKDRGPAKERGLRGRGSTDLRPDTLAGQKNESTPVGKGASRGCNAQSQGIRARGSHLHQSRPTTLQKGTRSTC